MRLYYTEDGNYFMAYFIAPNHKEAVELAKKKYLETEDDPELISVDDLTVVYLNDFTQLQHDEGGIPEGDVIY